MPRDMDPEDIMGAILGECFLGFSRVRKGVLFQFKYVG
jgi:hypothetical protein